MIKRSEVFEKEKQMNAEAGATGSVEAPSVTSFIGPNAVWGAIFAGIVMVTIIQLALALLGAGIGLSAINPDNAKAVGIGALTWWMLSGLVAFYFGGWTAGRLAGIPSRTDGILHGLVTWGTTTLIMFLFLTSTVGAIIGGGFSLLKSGGQAVAQVAPKAADAVGNAAQQSGVGGELSGSIRQTLQSRGIPPENLDNISAQLMSELAVLAAQAPENKEAQKQVIANTLVSNSNMNPSEARGMVNQWEQRGEQVAQGMQQGVEQAKDKAQEVAGKASDVAGKGALASFAMLFLTAIAAGLGGFAGTPWPEERI